MTALRVLLLWAALTAAIALAAALVIWLALALLLLVFTGAHP